MYKRSPNYILVAVLTIVTACISLFLARVSSGDKFNADLSAIPMKVGTWQGQDVDMGGDIKTALNADHIMYRIYTNSESGESLGLLIVYRKYGRRDFVHRPELCYPAAGWEIVNKSYTNLPYNGRDTKARLIVARKSYVRESVSYLFVSGSRTEANFVKQQMWMALDRVQKQHYGWAFIRLNTPEIYGHEEALNSTRAFMKLMDRPLHQALVGNG